MIFLLVFNPPSCHPPSCCHPDVQFVIPTQEGSQLPIKKFPQSYLLRNDKLRGCCHPPISLPSPHAVVIPRAVCHPDAGGISTPKYNSQ